MPPWTDALIASFICWSQRSAWSPTRGIAGRSLRTRRFQSLYVGGHPRLVEVVRQAADARADRHLVVVQDDQELLPEAAGVVQRLEDDARGERAVADHGHRVPIAAGPTRSSPAFNPRAVEVRSRHGRS